MTLRQVKHAHQRLKTSTTKAREARLELREKIEQARADCSVCDGSGTEVQPTACPACDVKHPWRECKPCPDCKGNPRGHTLAEIGKALGMTRQGVYDILRR
jgi:hypothetical protein